VKIQQRLPYGLRDQSAHVRLAMEPYLTFGGMNIYIHRPRINFNEKTTNRVTTLHQGGVVPFQQREIKSPIFYRPTINEQVLVLASRSRNSGRANETPNPDPSRGLGGRFHVALVIRIRNASRKIHRQELLIASMESAETFAKRRQASREVGRGLFGGQLPDCAAILLKGESHLGICQCR
jgi:hypothetical protein